MTWAPSEQMPARARYWHSISKCEPSPENQQWKEWGGGSYRVTQPSSYEAQNVNRRCRWPLWWLWSNVSKQGRNDFLINHSSALHMCFPGTKEKNEGIQMQKALMIWEQLGHWEAPMASISRSQTWHVSVFSPDLGPGLWGRTIQMGWMQTVSFLPPLQSCVTSEL